LEDARRQQDPLHITTIAVVSEMGDIVPIVKRSLEADSGHGTEIEADRTLLEVR
jgi:hypothetical protein